MIHRHFLLTLLMLFIASTAQATEAQQLFAKLDQNQDGSLESSEVATEHQRLFQRLLRASDTDQDQQLSSTEFQAGLKPNQPEKPLTEKQPSKMPGADALMLLLAKMDANADRRIERYEVPAQFREIFSRIEDRLGGEPDGVLDQREINQAAPKLSHLALRVTENMGIDVDLEIALLPKKQWEAFQNLMRPRRRGELLADPSQAREFFSRLDANGDGQIVSAEVPEQFATRFDRLLERADRNRDEQISEQELLRVSQMLKQLEANRLSPSELQKGLKRLLQQFDKNNDQQISRREAPRRMAARFQRIDTDGNGQLDREELTPVVELLRRMRPAEARRK